ncbi:MAG: hypothetical protein NXH75_15185 [Halobacteriovoraceae bacterium]|nr:hypothetical protein [Halobacteriovoraceae bacterium]
MSKLRMGFDARDQMKDLSCSRMNYGEKDFALNVGVRVVFF